MVAVSFLQSREVMFEVDKHINEHMDDVQVNTSFNYTLLDYPPSENKYFIEIDWKFKIVNPSGAVVLGKISSYVYMVKKIFRSSNTTLVDIEDVVDDSFKRFEEEFNTEKEGTNYADIVVSRFDKKKIMEQFEAFIENDIVEKNLF